MTRPQYINGRILLREHGGVRRYASEVSERLQQATVLQPTSAPHPWSARSWEQVTLANASKDGVLLSMAHSGPLRHKRHVVVIHDLLALRSPESVRRSYVRWLRGMLPALAKRAVRVVVDSSAVADEVSQQFDIPLAAIDVVYPGVAEVFALRDVDVARTALGLDPHRPTVAALLDPTPRKNSHQVAALLRELQRERSDLQVVVAGNNEPSAFSRQRGARAVDRSGFVDLGSAADVDLASMYQSADVFVSLTAGEGFGLPAVEAAACGAAVVTTPVPSAQERLGAGSQIISNAKEAKDAVVELLRAPNRRYDLSQRGAAAGGDLRWSDTAASLEAIMTSSSQT